MVSPACLGLLGIALLVRVAAPFVIRRQEHVQRVFRLQVDVDRLVVQRVPADVRGHRDKRQVGCPVYLR